MGNRIIVPAEGERISVHNGKLQVPDAVILPFVEGDGTGRDIWRASRVSWMPLWKKLIKAS